MNELHSLLRVAEEVSSFIRDNYYSKQAIFLKQYNHMNVSGDLQKGIDEVVNERIIALLKKENLHGVIISEETGIVNLTDEGEFFIVLDPIDGSNNVRPWFTPHPNLVISMGMGKISNLNKHGLDAIEISIVKEIFTENTYYSLKNEGAFFSNKIAKYKLCPSPNYSLDDGPVLGLDLDKNVSVSQKVRDLISRRIVVRRLGSTILDLCQVAAGQYDGYFSGGRRLKITDVCQPYALIKAAGGFMEVIPYYQGETIPKNFLFHCLENEQLLYEIRFDVIAAGNKKLLEQLKIHLAE